MESSTSKSGFADVLWAAKGRRTQGIRVDLRNNDSEPLAINPSKADTINLIVLDRIWGLWKMRVAPALAK